MGYFEVACSGQKNQSAMVWHSKVLATLKKKKTKQNTSTSSSNEFEY